MLKNAGIPVLGGIKNSAEGQENGDHIVTFKIKIPSVSELTVNQKEALEKYKEVEARVHE